MIMIGVNGYIMFVAYKLESAHGMFAKLDVVMKYHLLHNTNLIIWSMLLSIIILGMMFCHLINDFRKKCLAVS
jgi:hypothetical protein